VVDDADLEEQFVGPEPKSSTAVLSALTKAEHEFNDWQATCHNIDTVYNLHGTPYGGAMVAADTWTDAKLDLFWSSYEVLKPAVYARPPKPAVSPLFDDNKPLQNTTAELLERASVSTFTRTSIDDVMIDVRDDLIFTGRGVMWVRYDTDDGQQVCVEHVDRTDFRHEPARKWAEVGWVAKRSWLTRKEMRARFFKTSGNAYKDAQYAARKDREDGEQQTTAKKAGVWEVWHKANNKTYWVTEGVDVFLDADTPEVQLSGFFPCPRPAYATLRRRSLVPVPDYERYAYHFSKISELTRRIYLLLEQVRMMGIVGGGGDIADVVQDMWASADPDILVRVNSLTNVGEAVTWIPLADLATAITGLIEARSQLISDFYELSGISDIMRGATEAEETLGAQQLKSQYGSVRVRCKIDELQRIAADAVKIAAEIIAQKFTQKNLLDMAQMDIPSKADLEKRVKEIEDAAKAELAALAKRAQEAAAQAQGSEQTPAPAQAQQMLQQAQQEVLAKYAPMMAEVEQQVPIEDVMALLRDDRARTFTFEIQSDSTILTDEIQEKASRNEFMETLTGSIGGLSSIIAMGEPAVKLWGEATKFQLAPYRAGRSLDGAINAFIDAAPEMAQRMAAAQGEGGEAEGLIEANNKLAEAEQMKAQAAMAKVQADMQLKQAENERKVMEQQQKFAEAQAKWQAEAEKLRQTAQDSDAKLEKTLAEIDHLRAQTAEILNTIGLDVRKQELEEYRTAADQTARATDQAMAAQGQQTDAQFRAQDQARAERGEDRADRQQQFAEQQEPKP
jgi:hypothetical protein